MTAATPRFALPLLEAGQAAKEIAHNEALALADLLIDPAAEALGLDTPPAGPALGQCWIVGPAPVGAWAGFAHHLAGWTAGGWRFAAPLEGQRVWIRADALWALRTASAWVTGAAVAAPSGGAVIDVESRAALAQIVTILRQHGMIAT